MRVLKLITKNMLRHKLRTFLTILGIAIAVMAFGLIRTVVTAWYVGVEASAANRLITRHAVSFIFPLPLAYESRIERVPGINKVTFANWFGGVYIDKNQFFARIAVESDEYFDVYPELLLSREEREAFRRERNACIIGSELAQRYKLKIGDVMPIDGDIYPGQWEFVIRGIYRPRDKSTDPSTMFFHWRYIDERMNQETPERAGQVGWYVIRIDNPADDANVSQQVDAMFANSPAETKTETEKAFQQGFLASAGAIITAMNLVSFIIIGIIMLVLGNTMIMAARERVREYAVLKTLGFSGWHLVGLIAGESLFISLVGGAIGLALTFPLADGFAQALPKGWFPIFNVEPITIILASSAALLVGVISAVFPIQRALRTTIVEGLREAG